MIKAPAAYWKQLVCGVGVLVCAATAQAQFGGGYFREGSLPPRFAPAEFPDGDFTICRLMYTRVRSEEMGMGWATDYPYSERNLMTRMSELTKATISHEGEGGDPNTWVVRATDPQLFRCPYLVASDVGTIGLAPVEAAQLRDYLLKGGFWWVDDFWGSQAWEHWSNEIAKVLPPGEYPITDVRLDDPLLRSLFTVTEIPQITNIQFWRRWGGSTTSERGEDSREAHLRAIRDDHGRIMVLMTHNSDVADSWEREGEDPGFFYQFSPNGYALGIDVLLHAMTH
jgi:hypothetical protein